MLQTYTPAGEFELMPGRAVGSSLQQTIQDALVTRCWCSELQASQDFLTA